MSCRKVTHMALLKLIKLLFFHFRFEDQRPQIPKHQRCCDSGGGSCEAAFEDSNAAFLSDCLCDPIPQRIAKSKERYTCSGSGPFQKRFIKSKPS